MAEVLGLVAGGINVAQLTSDILRSAAKLKSFWAQIKDVPDDLQQLLEEIDTLGLILCQIESNHKQGGLFFDGRVGPSPNICVQRSFELCQKGVDELDKLVNVLSNTIEEKNGWRKKAGHAKVALKAKELKKLHRRMKNAIRLLNIAYQCHISAMMQAQPEIIIKGIQSVFIPPSKDATSILESDMQDSSGTGDSESIIESDKSVKEAQNDHYTSPRQLLAYFLGSLQYRQRHRRRKGQSVLEHNAKYTFPMWLSEVVWDILGFRTRSGWKLTLQSYHRLPASHDLFRLAARGDVEGMQKLLVSGEASVIDIEDKFGQTALHIAAREGHLDACRLLIDSGADSLAYSDNNQTPLHTITYWTCHLSFHKKRPAWEICRLLINSGADETLIEDISVIARRNGSKRILEYLLRQMFPSYSNFPVAQRFELAKHIRSGGWHNVPDLIKLLLGGSLNEEVINYTDSNGRTLLHYIALRWGFGDFQPTPRDRERIFDDSYDPMAWRQPYNPSNHQHPWRTLLRDTVAAGASLHALDNHGRTPLATLIRQAIIVKSNKDTFRRMGKILRVWLIELSISGTDLQKYGEKEEILDLKRGVNAKVDGDLSKLLRFTHASNPHDWEFFFTEPADIYLGQFWAIVEISGNFNSKEIQDLVPRIPGSWDESLLHDSELEVHSDSDCKAGYQKDHRGDDYGRDPDIDFSTSTSSQDPTNPKRCCGWL